MSTTKKATKKATNKDVDLEELSAQVRANFGQAVLLRLSTPGRERTVNHEEMAAAFPDLVDLVNSMNAEIAALRQEIAEGITTASLTVVDDNGQPWIYTEVGVGERSLIVSCADSKGRESMVQMTALAYEDDEDGQVATINALIDGNTYADLSASRNDLHGPHGDVHWIGLSEHRRLT